MANITGAKLKIQHFFYSRGQYRQLAGKTNKQNGCERER